MYQDKSQTTPKKVVEINLIDSYFMKLYKTIRTSSSIKDINICDLPNLVIYSNNYICQFNHLGVPENVQLMR